MKKVCLFLLTSLLIQSAVAADTWDDRRFRNMLRQELDMSCGAASIASLVRFYGGAALTEADMLLLLAEIVPEQDQAAVLVDGFSLLHIKHALQTLGLDLKAATTFNNQLVRFGSPALLQLKTQQGFHFVIWHGKYRGLHWLGDPSRGDMWLTDEELELEWTGIAAWVFKGGKKLPQANARLLAQAWERR